MPDSGCRHGLLARMTSNTRGSRSVAAGTPPSPRYDRQKGHSRGADAARDAKGPRKADYTAPLRPGANRAAIIVLLEVLMFRSGSPTLRDDTFRGLPRALGAAMTRQGTVNKTGLSLLIFLAA